MIGREGVKAIELEVEVLNSLLPCLLWIVSNQRAGLVVEELGVEGSGSRGDCAKAKPRLAAPMIDPVAHS